MVSRYMKAGYTPQCGCRMDSALEYVSRQLEMSSRIAADNCTIEVEIAPGLYAPSGYWWENDLLLKR